MVAIRSRWGTWSTRRKTLFLSGGATLVLLVASAALDRELTSLPGSSTLDLGISDVATGAGTSVVGWGDGGRGRVGLWVDFGLILSYSVFLAVAAASTREALKSREVPSLVFLGYATPVVALGAGLCNLAEDGIWLAALNGHASSNDVSTAASLAIVKLFLIGFVLGYLLIGLGARCVRRPRVSDLPAPTEAVAGRGNGA